MENQTSKSKEKISFDLLCRIAESSTSTVHFVGVGGVSMYALARLTMLLGAKITGSDRESNERTKELVLLGARVSIGHFPENVNGANLVVYTHAIQEDNQELSAALKLGIPIVSRAEYMGALMTKYQARIGVSGSHGKSSTVAMLEAIFSYAQCSPTVLSGADLPVGEPVKIGSRSLMIYEACEYRDSFLKFSPTISVGLNLELDHTDYFESLDDIKSSFAKALGKATRFSVISGDDQNLKRIVKNLKTRVVSFGSGENNDYRYSITSFKERGFEFTISRFGNVIGSFEINIPGVFNVHNATAAIVTSLEYGLDVNSIAEAIRLYRGIPRRLENIGRRYGREVYYDYAHHPTEIAASINALKELTHEPVTVVFKPHTFSRTKSLWKEFRDSLSIADYVILTDIYPAREECIEGITSERLAEEIGHTAIYCGDSDAVKNVDNYTRGTIVLMGAGDLERVKKEILI